DFTQTVCFDGKEMWIAVNGKVIMTIKDKDLDIVKETMQAEEVAGLVLQKEKGLELSLIGDDKVNDKPVVGVRVARKDKKDVSLFFDKETGLLAKVENRGVNFLTKAEVTQARVMSDYKEVGGQ